MAAVSARLGVQQFTYQPVAAEERGMTFSNGLPRVALADSLTPGYFLKPVRGFRDGARNTRGALGPPAPSPPKP